MISQELMNKIIEYRNKKNPFPVKNGIQYRKFDGETAVAIVEITKEHMNSDGTVHGAVAFVLADTTASILTLTDGMMHTTSSATINYLSAAKLGDTLIATATFSKKGRKMSYINVDIANQDNKPIAQVILTFYNLEIEITEEKLKI